MKPSPATGIWLLLLFLFSWLPAKTHHQNTFTMKDTFTEPITTSFTKAQTEKTFMKT